MPFLEGVGKERTHRTWILRFSTMEMDRDDLSVRLSALWNIIGLKRSLKEDRIPCQIEEVIQIGKKKKKNCNDF